MAASWLQRMSQVPAPLYSLSPELIEEMALYLRARDISSLILSCRRFHNIVLVQYACRTELAGVCNPLRHLSRSSIVGRMESLRRWEASWKDLGRYLSAAAPPCSSYLQRGTHSDLSSSAMIICSRSTGRAIRQVCASLHPCTLICARRFVQVNTNGKTDYPKDSIAITQAFSIEEDVLVSVLR